MRIECAAFSAEPCGGLGLASVAQAKAARRDPQQPESNRRMNNAHKTLQSIGRLAQAGLALTTLVGAQVALAASKVNDLAGGPAVNQIDLHPPVTKIAADQMWLHNFMLWVCTAIFVAVFGVMFYSIFKHRKSRGAKPADFHESVAVEIAWTVVPFIIVIAMALPATKVVVAMKDTTNADITIKATGLPVEVGL